MSLLGQTAVHRVVMGAAVAATSVLIVSGCSSSTTVTTDATPEMSIGVDDGSVNVGGSLPDYWPSEVPVPDEMSYTGGAKVNNSITAAFQSDGSASEAQSTYTSQLEAAGFSQESEFNAGGQGSLGAFKNGDTSVQVIAAGNNDGGAVLSVTILPTGTAGN